jgi:hypothetical protein
MLDLQSGSSLTGSPPPPTPIRFLVVLLSLSTRMPRQYIQIGHANFVRNPHLFTVHAQRLVLFGRYITCQV